MHAPGALALSAFTAFGTASPASAEAMFMGLGDLPGGRVASFANAVSADGSVVVGHSSSALALGSAYEAFRWTAADGMIGLGDLPGGGVR